MSKLKEIIENKYGLGLLIFLCSWISNNIVARIIGNISLFELFITIGTAFIFGIIYIKINKTVLDKKQVQQVGWISTGYIFIAGCINIAILFDTVLAKANQPSKAIALLILALIAMALLNAFLIQWGLKKGLKYGSKRYLNKNYE